MKTINLVRRLVILMAIAGLSFQFGCGKKVADVHPSNVGPESETSTDEVEEIEHVQKKESAPPAGFEFEIPVRLKAGNEFVSVEEPGYACPTMADVDGDNKLDLVVGQFNNGHMKFCKNVAGDGEAPKFAAAQWLMSGDDKATVPGVW